jgi:predicted ATP-dependent endonuclease of OLD family
MIKSIRFCPNHGRKIKNKEIAKQGLVFNEGYNVLIGPNTYGKSTILEALASCKDCSIEKL